MDFLSIFVLRHCVLCYTQNYIFSHTISQLSHVLTT